MQRIAAAEMAALVFEHKAVVVARAVVLNTLLVGCNQVQQVVAAFLQTIALSECSIRFQEGNQIHYKKCCCKKKAFFPTLAKGGKEL